jgi:hypothetical protein
MAHEHERRVHPRTHRPQLYPFLSIPSAEWAALACALIWAANGLLLRTQSERVTPRRHERHSLRRSRYSFLVGATL